MQRPNAHKSTELRTTISPLAIGTRYVVQTNVIWAKYKMKSPRETLCGHVGRQEALFARKETRQSPMMSRETS